MESPYKASLMFSISDGRCTRTYELNEAVGCRQDLDGILEEAKKGINELSDYFLDGNTLLNETTVPLQAEHDIKTKYNIAGITGNPRFTASYRTLVNRLIETSDSDLANHLQITPSHSRNIRIAMQEGYFLGTDADNPRSVDKKIARLEGILIHSGFGPGTDIYNNIMSEVNKHRSAQSIARDVSSPNGYAHATTEVNIHPFKESHALRDMGHHYVNDTGLSDEQFKQAIEEAIIANKGADAIDHELYDSIGKQMNWTSQYHASAALNGLRNLKLDAQFLIHFYRYLSVPPDHFIILETLRRLREGTVQNNDKASNS
jgi:hypothetical protein